MCHQIPKKLKKSRGSWKDVDMALSVCERPCGGNKKRKDTRPGNIVQPEGQYRSTITVYPLCQERRGCWTQKERFILMRYTNIQCLLIDCVIPSVSFHQMQVPSDRNRLLLLLLLGGWVSLPTISAECFWLGMDVRDRQVGFSQIKTGSRFLTSFSTLSPFFN